MNSLNIKQCYLKINLVSHTGFLNSSPKNENSVISYSPSFCSKPVRPSFIFETQIRIFFDEICIDNNTTNMVNAPLFHPCFMPKCSVLFFGGLFQRVLSWKYVIVCLFSCTHATLLLLCASSDFQRNLLNNGSKDQNLCVLVEYMTVCTNLGRGWD